MYVPEFSVNSVPFNKDYDELLKNYLEFNKISYKKVDSIFSYTIHSRESMENLLKYTENKVKNYIDIINPPVNGTKFIKVYGKIDGQSEIFEDVLIPVKDIELVTLTEDGEFTYIQTAKYGILTKKDITIIQSLIN